MNPPQPTKTLKVDHLPVKIYKDADSLGKAAALEARRIIQEAIDERDNANIILATGNSQLNFLESLILSNILSCNFSLGIMTAAAYNLPNITPLAHSSKPTSIPL